MAGLDNARYYRDMTAGPKSLPGLSGPNRILQMQELKGIPQDPASAKVPEAEGVLQCGFEKRRSALLATIEVRVLGVDAARMQSRRAILPPVHPGLHALWPGVAAHGVDANRGDMEKNPAGNCKVDGNGSVGQGLLAKR